MTQVEDSLQEALITQRWFWVERLFQVSALSTKFVLSYSSAAIGLTIVVITGIVKEHLDSWSFGFLGLAWLSLLFAITLTFRSLKLDAKRIAAAIAESDSLLEILLATQTGEDTARYADKLQESKRNSKKLYKKLVVVSAISEVLFVLGLLFTLIFVARTVTQRIVITPF
jgi:hypothetical protein